MSPEEPHHLADWQQEAVQAATNGTSHNSGQSQQSIPQPSYLPTNNPNEPGLRPTVGSFETPVLMDQETLRNQAAPNTKRIAPKKIVLFLFALVVFILLLLAFVSLSRRKNPSVNNLANSATHVREIPTDCYQFTIPLTYEYDLSTLNCTLSGGDGIQHELLGVQPIKESKTDNETLKSLSQFTLQSFSKSYPGLKQTDQSSGLFAGKSTLKTVASLNDNLVLTAYIVTPDKPYVLKDTSYPLVLITYIAPATSSDNLRSLEQGWQWH
jgi:hypothetical protein